MEKLKYYRKSKFSFQSYDCTSQTLTKKDIIKYIKLDRPDIKGYIINQFSWKKLMGIFYLLNYRDAQKSFNKLNQ